LLQPSEFSPPWVPDGSAANPFLPGDIMSMEEEDCQLSRDAIGVSV